MSLRGVDNKSLGEFDREDESEPPNKWFKESPAESQELRWYNEESGAVLWVESETDGGSPYAIFVTGSMDEPADIVETGLEDLGEAEVEAIKIMEEVEESKERPGRCQYKTDECGEEATHIYKNHATNPDTIKMYLCGDHAEEFENGKNHVELYEIDGGDE